MRALAWCFVLVIPSIASAQLGDPPVPSRLKLADTTARWNRATEKALAMKNKYGGKADLSELLIAAQDIKYTNLKAIMAVEDQQFFEDMKKKVGSGVAVMRNIIVLSDKALNDGSGYMVQALNAGTIAEMNMYLDKVIDQVNTIDGLHGLAFPTMQEFRVNALRTSGIIKAYE